MTLMKQYWNTDENNLILLKYWSTESDYPGAGMTILDKKTMSTCRLLVIYPTTPEQIRQTNRKIATIESTFGSVYLLEQNKPADQRERQIVYNYFANKYPWIGGSNDLNVVVSAKSLKSLQINNASYSLFLGLPINLFILRFD
jgi:hypothetical protein